MSFFKFALSSPGISSPGVSSPGVFELNFSNPLMGTPTRPTTGSDHPGLSNPLFSRAASSLGPAADAILVRRCQAGDRGAFAELFDRHYREVARIIVSIAPRNSERDDIVQETFIQVIKSIGRFRGNSSFKTWLYRVSLNTALRMIRRQRGQRSDAPLQEVVDSERTHCPQRRCLAQETAERVQQVLMRIELKRRTVLVMHHVHGFPTSQIAEMLCCLPVTVRTRLHYARREFIRLWDELCADLER